MRGFLHWFTRRGDHSLDPLDAEMRFHIERQIADHIRTGLDAAEARRRALLEFGGLDLAKEECRDLFLRTWLERIRQDVSYGARLLSRSPGFTIVAVISLALGIGANTAIFSVIDALMLRPLPVDSPEQLVSLKWVGASSPYDQVDSDEFTKYRDQVTAFSGMAGSELIDRYNLRIGGPGGQLDPSVVHVNLVSGNYFSVLGVRPHIGTVFTSADDSAGARPVAVISDRFARRLALGDGIVGKDLVLNGTAYTILGVMPAEFSGDWVGRPTDVWVPLAMHSRVVVEAPGLASVRVIARMRPGVGTRQAEAAIEPVFQQVIRQRIQTGRYPPALQRMWAKRVKVRAMERGYSPQRDAFAQPLAIVMAVVGLILLIACANIATLLLARAAGRQREMTVRRALGASKGRVIQQLLIESVLLSATGGVLGVLCAAWGTRALARLVGSGPVAFLGAQAAPANLSLTVDLHPDLRVIMFSAALCILTGLLFGIAPAFLAAASSRGSALAVRGSATDFLAGRFGLRKVLVIAQVALSLLLVAGAGLFVRTLHNLRSQDLGFDRTHVLLVWTNPFEVPVSDAPLWNLWHDVQVRLASLPGVDSAGVSNMGLLNGFPAMTGSEFFAVPGQQPKVGQHLVNQKITAGYFETVGIHLLGGRDFTPFDTDSAAPAIILNATMARFYFGEQNPVGRRLDFMRPHNFPPYTVVGVVHDALNGLHEPRTGVIYYPSTQTFFRGSQSMVIAVRAAGNPAQLGERVKQELHRIRPDLPILKIDTVDQQVDSLLARERLVSLLAEYFGALALLLACLGLFGVLSYMVTRRTNEIGVRMALGAGTKEVLTLVLGEGLAVVLSGIAIGSAAALVFGQLITTQLFGVRPSDPTILIGSASLMVAIGVLACSIPARRAAKVEPMAALRRD